MICHYGIWCFLELHQGPPPAGSLPVRTWCCPPAPRPCSSNCRERWRKGSLLCPDGRNFPKIFSGFWTFYTWMVWWMGYEWVGLAFCESEVSEAFWCSLFRWVLSHLEEPNPFQNQFLFEFYTIQKFDMEVGTNQKKHKTSRKIIFPNLIFGVPCYIHGVQTTGHIWSRSAKEILHSPLAPSKKSPSLRFAQRGEAWWRGPEVVGSFEDVGVWLCMFALAPFFFRKGGWSPNVTTRYFLISGLGGLSEYFWGCPETLQKTRQGLDSGIITKGSLLAGYLEFYFAKQRGGLDPLSLNDQEKRTPPSPPRRELSPYAWWVSSRSSPFAVSRHHHHHHHQHHHHHPPQMDHHHSTWNSDFSTSIFQVPNGAMKVTGSSIHRYRKKRHWSLC